MIAIDGRSWIGCFSGSAPRDADAERVSSALADPQAWLPPVVLTELMSDPKLPGEVASLLLADALIAQSCIDHDVRLVTRDADFRHFARLGGLRLAV